MNTTKQTKHTPGPWEAHQEKHGLFVSARSFCIAKMGDGNSPMQSENAALIAAAPELLKALRDVKLQTHLDMPPTLAIQIDEAIAKAEGRS